jgi:hypothetical protein
MELIIDSGMAPVDQYDPQQVRGDCELVNYVLHRQPSLKFPGLLLESPKTKDPYQLNGYLH